MNSNFPKSIPKVNKSSKISINSNNQNKKLLTQGNHPLNLISIMKTEEQKKVVRTNVYEPNNSDSGKDQHFTVITEVINRSSNISLDPHQHSFNNGPINFSFNQISPEEPINQSFQNKNKIININIADSSSKLLNKINNSINSSNEYKSLIKRIAMKLKKRVREPTQGYFYFAFQKGNYPLIIIRKIQNQIINHNIEFNNNIFRIYTQKYAKYKELIKKIAFLLKKTMKKVNLSAPNIQLQIKKKKNDDIEQKTLQINISQNTHKVNIDNNMNVNNAYNIHNNKMKNNEHKKNTSKDNINAINKKNINVKNFRNNNIDAHTNFKNISNTNSNSNSNIHLQKKSKPQTNKINSSKNNNLISSQNNIASHKISNIVSPFVPGKERKKVNLTKKSEIGTNIIYKNPFINKPQINNKEKNKAKNKNINKGEIKSVASAPTNKNERIINININKASNITNEITYSSSNNIKKEKQDDININDKMDIINEEVKAIQNNDLKINFIPNNNINNMNNNIKLDLISTQSEPIIINDESDIKFNRINSDTNYNKKEIILKETNININEKNNNISNKKKIDEMNIIPNNNNLIIPSNNNDNINLNPIIMEKNNVKKISLNSIKNSGKKIEIKLSNFKKEQNIINSNENKNLDTNIVTNIDQQNINNFQQEKEQNALVNKINTLLVANNIIIESYLPIAQDEKGNNILKQNKFWEDYIQYLYELYLIKNTKISLFYFIQIMEQYFIWCENTNSENNFNFKKIIIDIVNKIYNEHEISIFLTMNKINNLDELFIKYEIFMTKYNNNNYEYGKEIEIKLDNNANNVECNCELCSNEIACINKMIEINKNLITNVITDNIFYSGENTKKESPKKIKNPMFSNSKTKYSFEYQYLYIPRVNYQKLKKYDDTEIKKENMIDEEKQEKFIDISLNYKIDDFFGKEEKDDEKNKKNRKKSRKSRNKKNNKIKDVNEIEDGSDSDNSDSEKEKVTKNKKNKKNKKKAKKKKYIEKNKDESSDNEDNDNINSDKKKKTYPYHKVNKKSKYKK